jgi:SAM-dependent methyltransferase
MLMPCGCVNIVDDRWAVTRCLTKCDFHKSALANQPSGLAYYQSLGSIDDSGKLLDIPYLNQIEDALGPLPEGHAGDALEIGGGASPYLRALLNRGYKCTMVEADAWACEWTRTRYPLVDVLNQRFPVGGWQRSFDLIICAHSLEHMGDAGDALLEIHKLLKPNGKLWIVVPNDEDLTNPDHFWFFNPSSLAGILDRTGFTIDRLAVRQIVKHEKFIYVSANRS